MKEAGLEEQKDRSCWWTEKRGVVWESVSVFGSSGVFLRCCE